MLDNELFRLAEREFGIVGAPVRVTIERHDVTVLVSIDAAEHHRRITHGLAGWPHFPALCALSELPLGSGVPLDGLHPGVREALIELPQGFVALERDLVRREIGPAIRIEAAFARCRSWAKAEHALAPFVTVCPRVAVLSSVPSVDSVPMTEAVVYGIGIVASQGDEHRAITAPAHPYREFGAFQWSIAEIAYAKWRSTTSPTPSPDR